MNDELIHWLDLKLAEAEAALKFRVESEACWKGGTDMEWKAAGCRLSRAKRLETSSIHGRIAVKCRHDIAMLKRAIAILSGKKPENFADQCRVIWSKKNRGKKFVKATLTPKKLSELFG